MAVKYLGIDPAARLYGLGVCLLDWESRAASFPRFRDFLKFYDWLLWSGQAPAEAIVGIENSNLTRATFDQTGGPRVAAAKSRSVGKNQELSKLLALACSRKYGEDRVVHFSPKQKGGVWSEKTFRGILAQDRVELILEPGQVIKGDDIAAYMVALFAKQQRTALGIA
jgi:hypothetical protein